jgi:hypothetical protein
VPYRAAPTCGGHDLSHSKFGTFSVFLAGASARLTAITPTLPTSRPSILNQNSSKKEQPAMFGLTTRIRTWRRGAAVLLTLGVVASAMIPANAVLADNEKGTFPLIVANSKLLPCLAQDPDDPKKLPTATVSVARGELNDTLHLHLRGIKPGLNFDLFTIQHSNKLADGAADPALKNFGFAWYQTDIHADENGNANVAVRTILLDQIFGFDPEVGLQPTNTFHVGFWFNNPKDAEDCGFAVNKPTPFNGEHKAGPLAMISLPDDETNLGPLCRNPDLSSSPVHCNP